VIRKLEADAKEGRKVQAELEQLKRERAYVAAGVPLDDPRTPYFIAGYQGEQSAEAIRHEWQEKFGAMASGNSPVEQELSILNDAQALVSGVGTPAPDKLAQRNAELGQLSQTDPLYTQKFDAIAAKYGTRTGSVVG
jgi:hypothetical protein